MDSKMKFSIITPTLQRKSLKETCDSVDRQTYKNWQHVVIADVAELNLPPIAHKNRLILQCPHPHRNGGNSCRHNALDFCDGDYIYYLDDDNFLADPEVLWDIAYVLETSKPPWAIFPIWRLGSIFFSDPPRSCHTDTLNLVLRKDMALWPETDAYGSDGVLVESLKSRGIMYSAYPNFRPIAVLPKISFCKEDE